MGEKFRKEVDSLGEIQVPENKLWGAQTQRSLKYFSMGNELIPSEMIESYALLKKAAAMANFNSGGLNKEQKDLIVLVCNEILDNKHFNQFPLHVWMTGSGTQFNMNINEVISNRCSQIAGTPLGSKEPVHPNDHVNMSQSSNDTFPSAMHISTAKGIKERLIPAVKNLRNSLNTKAEEWEDIIKVGRTHMQDATPLSLGQEFSGYVGMLDYNLERLNDSLNNVYEITLGGTAIGTGINAFPEFGEESAQIIAELTNMPFKSAKNKFALQGSHDSLIAVSGCLKNLAASLYKISNDIRLLSCGPRCGLHELEIPSNEPGSSIMPGKVNPTQCEALSMISVQVMANDMAVTVGGAGGHLEMNVYKPLIIHNIMQSIKLLTDGCHNFREFLVEGLEANKKQINYFLERSLMMVTALSPVIGYDKAAHVAHYALENDLTLKEAVLKLNYVSEEEFDSIVDPKKLIHS